MASDIAGLDDLIRDLSDAPRRLQGRVDGVVDEAAQRVQDDWRRRASGLRHAPHYPRSITTDAKWTRGGYEAEVGPDKDLPGLQGALGNLIERGSVNNAPHANDVAAAEAEAPRFTRAIEGLVDL